MPFKFHVLIMFNKTGDFNTAYISSERNKLLDDYNMASSLLSSYKVSEAMQIADNFLFFVKE